MIIIPKTTELAVQRGRFVSLGIYDALQEHKAAGRKPRAIRVSREVASDMRAYFTQAFQQFDNILPPSVLGVPFTEGGTDGKDVVIEID